MKQSATLNYLNIFRILTVFMLCNVGIIRAQEQNALNFDGIDDKVDVPSASAMIANSNLSLTLWVFPGNPNPVFPDFDGFAGFRNDLDADFYLVQIAPSIVEARFRNSAGVAYTLTDSNMQSNRWQHYALIYDGIKVKLYKDGLEISNLPASGNILSTTESFNIGHMVYSGNDFYLQGEIDEVSLWNKALSPAEVNCIYSGTIDTSRVGLRIYYQFNQGTATQYNPNDTVVLDAKGHFNGVMSNFAYNGPFSNWVPGIVNYGTFSYITCQGTPYLFAGRNLDTAGVYMGLFLTTSNCDSLVQLTLTIDPVDTTVTVNGTTLTAQASGANFAWIDCDAGGDTLAGEHHPSYTPVHPGHYAVIVTQSCTDTSGCFYVNTVGINENYFSDRIRAFPNPVGDELKIDLGGRQHNITIRITDLDGREVMKSFYQQAQNLKIDASYWVPGVYIMEVISGENRAIKRITKK